jgi:hypothetical protein
LPPRRRRGDISTVAGIECAVSNFLAIAGVTSTLRNLLRDRMEQVVDITLAPPDVTISGVTGRRLNVYLYQLTENGYLKNQEIPGQGHPADYGRPPLSLDLHYLLTAYGSSNTAADADLQAQETLGDAMRVLHEFPVVTEALHEGDNPANPVILDPSLVGEFEKIKMTLQPISLEDLSKIWTALPETNFRRSVAYQVSVIQIESQRPRRSALPVRERHVYAVPLKTPRVTEIVRDPPFDGVRTPVAEVGDPILIFGENLRRDSTRVRFGPILIPVPAPQSTLISLSVPPLPPGAHTVQVIHDLLLEGQPGQPLVPHRGFESNVTVLLVIPRWVGIAPASAGAGAVVTITVATPVGATQEKSLLLGDFTIAAEPVPTTSAPSTTIQFRLPAGPSAIPPGGYLARIRVDGMESRLTVNAVTQLYNGPTFTVL